MRRFLNSAIFILLALLPITALAHDFEVNGIYYLKNGTEATVTYQGTYSSQYSNEYSGYVTIPSTVTYNGTTYSVTSIGDGAFFSCSGLTSIAIPNSVSSIGDNAFYGCSGLANFTIPNSVTSNGGYALESTAWFNNQPEGLVYAGLVAYKYKGTMPDGTSITIAEGTLGIAGGAFYDCSCLTSISIPNSVTFIGHDAFNFCSGLASVTIPNSVTSISNYAFSSCSGLSSITISNSVTSIGNNAFSWCSSLTSITIPNSVTSIGNNAFYGCSGLTSITIPNSVTDIGDGAFSWCSCLTSISIPNSVISIGNYAFDNCSGLTSIKVENGNPKFDSRNNCNAIIETATNTLIAGCMNTIIPNSVTSIGNNAFYGCSGLTSITIPNSVTDIGDYVFEYCSGLTSVTCVATMPPITYSYTFPSAVTTRATLYVPRESLSAYKVADNWKDFSQIVGITVTPAIDDFEVDGVWYQALSENTAMVIQKPDEGDLYQGDVVIPDSVTYLDYTLSVTAIDEGAFEDCYDLTSVVIGDAVETIGENTFQGCTGLTSVTIGSGVSSVGAKAFNYCNVLQTVTCLGTVPPVMANVNCFSNAAYSRAILHVPRQQLEAYQGADYWYRFSNIEGWGSCGMGDVNADGTVSIRDVTVLINMLLTGSEYNTDGDLNYNGKLDIGDVTSLIVFLLSQ